MWFAGATTRDTHRLQRSVCVCVCRLPSLRDLHVSLVTGWVTFCPQAGGTGPSIRTRTSRLNNSSFPSAISLMNTK